jgi:hypothetical protein
MSNNGKEFDVIIGMKNADIFMCRFERTEHHYRKYRFWQLPKTQSCCKKCFSQRKNCFISLSQDVASISLVEQGVCYVDDVLEFYLLGKMLILFANYLLIFMLSK